MDSNVTASIIKNKRTTLERIEKFISETYFTDVNLYGKLYTDKKEVLGISHWQVPGGVGQWENWDITSILKQKDEFSPIKIGDVFGPSWTTHWFMIHISIPDVWEGKEVRLRWKSQSEAMVWDMQGRPLQGLSSGTSHQMRTDFCLSKSWNPKKEKSSQTYLIEMVCSKMFGIGQGGMINPPNPKETFTLEMAEICVLNNEIYSLLIDLQVLHDLAKHLSEDQRGYLALYAGNQMVNYITAGDLSRAKKVAKEFFSKRNGDRTLTLALMGNCHIDSAWLWPFSETKRKCARSWSSTLRLMQDYPEMIFSCSQALQFDWVKQLYPHIYSQIKAKVKEGKFVPVGSTWVEMDGLLPSGESFIRQFLYGQKFYKEEFGSFSNIFWLPDTFGYSGQIPQICKHFGVPYFLTQKLCWNLVNKFPHHTFIWEGIDGSSVLAHFPSGDSYELNINVEEVLRTEKNLTDKGRVSIAGFLYGYGDGGGGPTQDMLERARRLQNVDGCPKLKHMSPVDMFKWMSLEERNLCKWVGELYLELHNGTYTSQAQTKQYNRKCEFKLRNVEILLAMVASLKRATEDEIRGMREECEVAWKKVLLNQFHDVLPGSSIGMVYEDSNKAYEEALLIISRVEEFCIRKLCQENVSKSPVLPCLINFLPWSVTKVIEISDFGKLTELHESFVHKSNDKSRKYVAVEVPSLSLTTLETDISSTTIPRREAKLLRPPSVLMEKTGDTTRLQNQLCEARFNQYGELLELSDKEHGSRNVFGIVGASGGKELKGNRIALYDDIPLFWDAWDVMDYHLETRSLLNTDDNKRSIQPLKEVEIGPLRVELQFEVSFGRGSSLRQSIIMTAVDPFLTFQTLVDWKEAHKFMKVEFETGLLARSASYDVQFGHIQRPSHANTSWDTAKFEVSGHKWANISEYDCGLSVLNDSKYGWSAKGGTLALSLLRAPKAPDDECDIGKHTFTYAVLAHKGILQESRTMKASYEINSLLRVLQESPAAGGISNWLNVKGEGVMIESVKVSEASSRAIVIRLYEMFGGARSVCLQMAFPASEIWDCDGMEELVSLLPLTKESIFGSDGCTVNLTFRAFQIKTIKLLL